MTAPADRYRRAPGIPTKHKDRQMRSGLEKKWATFFDLVGWRYEYEPFELDGWIPDFAIFGEGHSYPGDGSTLHIEPSMILVEIKPVRSFPEDVAEKVARSGWEGEVVVLGCTVPVDARHPASFGWLRERFGRIDAPESSFEGWWEPAILGRWENAGGKIGFCHAQGCYTDRISGHHESCIPELEASEVANLWTCAGNLSQWKAPR